VISLYIEKFDGDIKEYYPLISPYFVIL